MVEFLGDDPENDAAPAEIVEKLTAVRRRLRLARSKFAETLGCSYATIWAWETGQRRPRGRSLALLRRFLATHAGKAVNLA